MGYFFFLLFAFFLVVFLVAFFLRLAISAFLSQKICLHLSRNKYERGTNANMRVIYKRRVAKSNRKKGY